MHQKKENRRLEDCQFGVWSNWTSCSVTCGGDGVRTRSRVKFPAVGSGKECDGSDTETEICTSAPCVGACVTTDWTEFTPCSKSCNVGSQTRTRTFISQQPNCTDSLVETQDCNIGCCPGSSSYYERMVNRKTILSSIVDGVWSSWSEWSNCTVGCNGGQRTRTRLCNQPAPDCNGKPCAGEPTEIESCNTQPCTGLTCTDGKVLSNCSNACDTSCSTLKCNQQCSEPERCEKGCICANDTVMDAEGNCIKQAACQCIYEGKPLLPGQTITVPDKCQEW